MYDLSEILDDVVLDFFFKYLYNNTKDSKNKNIIAKEKYKKEKEKKEIKMSKTSGQYLEENINFFTELGKKYIEKHLVNIEDVCYVPFAMKTYYTRAMIKKINNDEYICFDGYVKDIEADELDSFKYIGDTNNKCNSYTKEDIIGLCAFEFSINNYYRELLEKK